MKILILQDDFPPESIGGAGFSTLHLARGLNRAGHQVFVITTCREKTNEGELDYEGLKVFRIYADYYEKWRAYITLYNPQTIKKVRKIIQEINPDIVHANNIHYCLSYHCLRIAKQYNKVVFLTARDVMSFNYGKLATKKYLDNLDCRVSWWDNIKQARKRYNPFRNFLIKRYLKYVDKIFSVSYALKDALAQNGINDVEVNHTGIDVNDQYVSPEKIEDFKKRYDLLNKKIVFFSGRISGLKGIGQINQVIARVKKEIPETILFIAGSKEIGWLHGDNLKAAYSVADIVVVPSISCDAFPRSNLEAMASKKAVITTKYGGSKEIVVDGITGYIVNPLDVDEFTGKLLDLLKKPEKLREFGQAGYERVKKDFNLERHVKQTLDAYEYGLKHFKKINWWQNTITSIAIFPFMIINQIIVSLNKITKL